MAPIPARLERLLLPQERIDRLRDTALRRAGRSFVDLAYANSYDGPAPDTLAALRRALEAPSPLALQYTPYAGATVPRRLVAESLRTSHDRGFQPWDVILTPGAMAALNLVFRSLSLELEREREHERGEVIVITPCWLDYPTYLENLGLSARFVPVRPETLRLDLPAIEAAIGAQTRALVLSQPANPSGLIYDSVELAELGRILQRAPSRPVLISDECHRDLVFEPHRFVSPVAFYDETVVVYSFGKKLALQGQRLGYVAVSPRHRQRSELAGELARLTRVMGFCTPTALMQLALGELLGIAAPLPLIAPRRARALALLEASGYDVQRSEATFFLYPRAPGGDDWTLCERLAERGVMVLPAAVFHHTGHFRISLTCSDELLERGLSVLAECRGQE